MDKRLAASCSSWSFTKSTDGRRRVSDRAVPVGRRVRRCSAAIVTARVGGQLVGVARSLTDSSYCAYLSDVAVDAEHQGRGIAGCG